MCGVRVAVFSVAGMFKLAVLILSAVDLVVLCHAVIS
jgi:hypothetical protein